MRLTISHMYNVLMNSLLHMYNACGNVQFIAHVQCLNVLSIGIDVCTIIIVCNLYDLNDS